jgi:hypothetical protein
MPFKIEWMTPAKTVMLYRVTGDWNWFDYHRVVRVSIFQMTNHAPQSVHSVVDLRGSTRPKLPSGLAAHVRTFGKRYTPALSGKAIVLGLPPEALTQIVVEPNGTLETDDGRVYFVADDDAMHTLLATF